jgi:hypothetical protein
MVTDAVLASVYPGMTTLGAGVVSRISFEMKNVWDEDPLNQIFVDNLVLRIVKLPLGEPCLTFDQCSCTTLLAM